MKPSGFQHIIVTLGLVLALAAQSGHAAARSELSRWLGEEAGPQLNEVLAGHPRFAGRKLILVGARSNGLAEAIAITLDASLSPEHDVVLREAKQHVPAPAGVPRMIDQVDCRVVGDEALLRIHTQTLASGARQVQLSLYDEATSGEAARNWQWLGQLSRDEQKAMARETRADYRDGSLEAPWQAEQVSLAAEALQRELACALRPLISTRLVLDWQASHDLPEPMTDAMNHTRRLLAGYGEIGMAESAADYRVQAEFVAFQADTWQLRLRAQPAHSELPPLDAVTYFSLPGFELPAEPFRPPLKVRTVDLAKRGAAFNHLRVELIDALQGQAARSRAALEVTFRVSNTSPWPIDYGFSLSGGHYQHCVAEAAYYRHDRYGYVEGRLEAGESLVRRMVIEGARHNPNPWFGPRRCAGFRSLEGFEDFSGKGRSVTQFVRWAMI